MTELASIVSSTPTLEIIFANRNTPRSGGEVDSYPFVDDLVPDGRRKIT